jgi:hypothetical protein
VSDRFVTVSLPPNDPGAVRYVYDHFVDRPAGSSRSQAYDDEP